MARPPHALELRTDLPVPAESIDLRVRYPFASLEVGANLKVLLASEERRALAAVRKFAARREGWTYVTGRDDEGFLRIWRKS